MTAATTLEWTALCHTSDLVPYSGIAARFGDDQVALFFLPEHEQPLFALCNHDPVSRANVIARGIVGDISGEPVVASPLYKQHYALKSGLCLEQTEHQLRTWPVRVNGDAVEILVG